MSANRKVAVVTGATRGVGRMIAGTLLEEGMTVYIGSRDSSSCHQVVQELAELGDCRPLPGQITDDADCRRMASVVESDGCGVHLLVNNAAYSGRAPMFALEMSEWDEVFAVNVRAPFQMVRALLPVMLGTATREDPGRVVNIGSISGLFVDGLPSYAYSSSKAALHHLTRVLAQELTPQNVNVNAIALGPFATESMQRSLAENRAATSALRSPMRRTGRAEEIGGLVLFLAGEAGAYMTGAIIPFDGGVATTR